MNTQLNEVPDSPPGSRAVAPAVMSENRPLYWSIGRELWENRSIYMAPLAVAAVYLFGFLISLFWVPRSMRGMGAHHEMPAVAALAMPYSHAAMLIMLIALLVGIFYSLDALHSERRDRSILFWKSLPVSDFATVLSKASIPLVVLPLLTFAITVALQLIMLLLNATVLLVSGRGTAMPWAPPLFEMELVTLYGTAVLALWHAPIWSPAGRGARHFYGRCYRRWRLPLPSTLRSTLRTWALCCKTDCLDSPRALSISRTRMASRSMRILFHWHSSPQEGF
jgi:ABC-2 type transport system permease protein